MDQVKIGQFIKSVRKEKSLTQREVAEKLNISEKTISKWETGSGLPEVSLMLPLCKILEISVNELLSGERLDEKRYFEKAEENIVSLATDKTNPKLKLAIAIVSCILTFVAAITLSLIAAYFIEALWGQFLIGGLVLIIILANIAVIVVIAVNIEIYECKNCGEKFVPTLSAYVMGMHTPTKRYLKCPHCGKRNWCRSHLRK